MGLQAWEHHVTREGGREGVAVPLHKAMVPLHVTSAASWALLLLEHWQEGKPTILKVGELGYGRRTCLGKIRWGDEEMNVRIY